MQTLVTIFRVALAVAIVLFFISGLDDLFVDIYFYVRRTYRRWFVEKKYAKLTEQDLRNRPEQPIAIMIPAWHEDAVIAKMLTNTLNWLDYANYDIFIGTYPNDDATAMAVAAVQQYQPRVHRIVCPHDGPTNKADCLNWIYEGILLYEKQNHRRFEIFCMHDSEDIVHPLSLKLMNYLIPRIHMVQLPVMALELPLTEFTAATYLDEFAEFHTKDLLVRERVSGMVPSAGVGTGFSRWVCDQLADTRKHQLFNVETFTEDYDFGFRLHDLHKKSILLQFSIDRTQVVRKGIFRRREVLKQVRELVATREFFPLRFRDAVRQKSRWIFGIVFQGWKQLGWRGGARMKYMIWRDRKALFANFINVFGYVVVLGILALYLIWLIEGGRLRNFPALVEPGTWLWTLMLVDTGLMVNRLLQRGVAVRRVASWPHALLSLPRIVWGNIINFCAVASASRQFASFVITGERVPWAKTDHVFPTEKQLLQFKRKLGDLLLENRLLSLDHLAHALEVQKQSGKRLGDVLTSLGYITEEKLVPILGMQLGVEARRLGGLEVSPEALKLIPASVARELGALVIGKEEETYVIAAADPASPALKTWLRGNFPEAYRLVIAAQSELGPAIAQAYGAIRPRRMLGELLIEAGVITAEQLAEALVEQQRTGQKLGQVLEAMGLITPEVLEEKIRQQQAMRAAGSGE